MSQVQQQQHQQQAQQAKQQQMLAAVQRALVQAQKAVAIRQQHLAAGNSLLGHSHHLVAAAAVEAAVLAASAAATPAPASGAQSAPTPAAASCPANCQQQQGCSGTATCQHHMHASLGVQHSLAVLQDCLSMRTETEVCEVLLQLQELLAVTQSRLAACSCGACTSTSSADSTAGVASALRAVLQRPCNCRDSQSVVQDSLALALQHLCSSSDVLSRSRPPDSLALAVERAACCAAGLALVSATAAAQAGTPHEHSQPGGDANGCCRCSAVVGLVGELLSVVVSVVTSHVGMC